jgi:hypothetical protein
MSTAAKLWTQSRYSSMSKGKVVYVHSTALLDIEKCKITQFSGKYVGLESIVLGKIAKLRKKNTMFPLIGGICRFFLIKKT